MITFDGNIIEDAEIIVNKTIKSGSPKRELQTEALGRLDGFVTLANFWRSRTIVLTGNLITNTPAELISKLDNLKKNLSGIEKNLDITLQDGTVRRYIATMSAFEAPEEHYNITHLPFDIEFTCQPFGLATSVELESFNSITGGTFIDSITTIGSAESELKLTFTFNNASGVSFIKFTGTESETTIFIEENIETSDILIIDSTLKTVYLNGVEVDFTGTFPVFIAGENNFDIEVVSTSHNYDLDIEYTPRFL